jgi:branched-chain amino acid transport system permease protein
MTAPGPVAEAAGPTAGAIPTVVPASTRSVRWLIVGMVVLLVVAPFVAYPIILIKALCFALFACAFNLLLGYAGLLSFGHALFFGGAGYIAGQAASVWGLPFELSVLLGTAAAALLGLAVGWLAIRRQGIYFAMITLAMAQMFYFYCLRAKFTGGEDGIQGIPRGKLLGLFSLDNNLTMYFVVLALFLFGFLAILRIVHSPFGHVLTAIRENEPRAISLGYKTDHYKLIAFVLSAALSGLAGAIKSIVFQLASLTDVSWNISGEVILMVLLGGLGTLFGPVVGAFVIVVVENYLAQIGGWVTVVQGALFVVCVLAFRRGIVGELSRLLHRPL